jgi:putative thioredoxin
MVDVTDDTFEQEVLVRSATVPVVVDLWAPWCGPCVTLGPVLEDVVARTTGAVELVKVNIDENPQIAASFQVQSIPAVFALRDGKVVDAFIGAQPEAQVAEFVGRLAPPPSEADLLVAAGDEASLRQALELVPDHPGAVAGLAALLIDQGRPDEALSLLARIPETTELRALAARARLADQDVSVGADVAALLDPLLERVREDEAARQEFIDVLETLGPDDPRTARYRKALAARLF